MGRTYGLGGAGLAGVASQQQAQSMEMLGRAADEEQRLGLMNQQREQERVAGNRQLGSSVGAMAGMAIGAQYGAAGGPWGAAIGGLVGAVAGGLF